MGNFTAEQITAIKAGTARIRQTWTLLYPVVSGGPITTEEVLHNGVDLRRTVDAGSREAVVYNQTLQEPGEFRANNYRFSMANGDNYLSFKRTGSVWDKVWMLDPIECNIRHQVYIGIAGVWSELTFLTFLAGVEDVSYLSVGSKGEALNKVALFTCNNRLISRILRKVWDSSDGTDTDTGQSFITTEAV